MTDPTLHLLVEVDEEQVSSRLRETFLVSLVVHAAAILFLVTNPDLLERLSPRVVVVKPEEQKVTMLYEPPVQQKPKPPQLKAPVLPRMEGTNEAEVPKPAVLPPFRALQAATPGQPAPPRGDRGEDLLARGLEPIGIPKFPEAPKEPPRQRPALEPVPRPKDSPSPSEAQLRLPNLAPPSRGTDAILREMAKQHAAGGGAGKGSGYPELDPQDPNFNLPGPQILSDTMGVDFDPYLLRVYLIVRRNWYSVIPEIARLGRQGRVVLQFSILRNGTVPDLVLTSRSGTESLDTAALASIRLSNPFPPLPAEFPGGDIRLRFVYFYNMRPDF